MIMDKQQWNRRLKELGTDPRNHFGTALRALKELGVADGDLRARLKKVSRYWLECNGIPGYDIPPEVLEELSHSLHELRKKFPAISRMSDKEVKALAEEFTSFCTDVVYAYIHCHLKSPYLNLIIAGMNCTGYFERDNPTFEPGLGVWGGCRPRWA